MKVPYINLSLIPKTQNYQKSFFCFCDYVRMCGCGWCVGVWVCVCVGVRMCGCAYVWVCVYVRMCVCGWCVGVWFCVFFLSHIHKKQIFKVKKYQKISKFIQKMFQNLHEAHAPNFKSKYKIHFFRKIPSGASPRVEPRRTICHH
jgi:hypothetical protein